MFLSGFFLITEAHAVARNTACVQYVEYRTSPRYIIDHFDAFVGHHCCVDICDLPKLKPFSKQAHLYLEVSCEVSLHFAHVFKRDQSAVYPYRLAVEISIDARCRFDTFLSQHLAVQCSEPAPEILQRER